MVLLVPLGIAIGLAASWALARRAGRHRDDSSVVLVWTAGILVVLGGVALGALRFVGGRPVEQGLEGALAAAALGAMVAAPGALALLSLLGRPALLLAAAVILVPLSVISLAGATLPLLLPAGMLFVAHGRRSAGSRDDWIGTAVTAVAVVSLLFAAFVALLIHDDPRTVATGSSTHSTSDVVVWWESLLSLALTSAAVAAGWFAARPD